MKLRITIALIAAVLIVPALSAQVNSNTYSVTQGLFRTDVDNIQDVNDWSTVEFSKIVGYAGAYSGSTGVTGGFATHLGNLFLGVGYRGYLWNGNDTAVKVDGDPNDPITPGVEITFDNYFAVLLGNDSFGGIKINLGLSGFGVDTDEDKYPAGTDQKRVDTAGSLSAGLTWGKNFTLGGGTLKPEFGLNVYSYLNGSEVTDSIANSSLTTKNGNTQISLRAAAEYEFAPQGNVTTTLSGAYTFSFTLKPDPCIEGKNTAYSGYGIPGGSYASFRSTDKGATIGNNLSAFYRKRYDINDRLSAAWNAGGYLSFNFSEIKYSGSYDGTSIDDKGTVVTGFDILPSAAAAFTYEFAGKPFSISAGTQLRTEVYIYKTENKNSPKTVTTSYDYYPLGVYFGLGGALTPSENFTLDLRLSGGTTGISNFEFTFDASSINIGFLLSFKV
jgi:hypothetical protein